MLLTLLSSLLYITSMMLLHSRQKPKTVLISGTMVAAIALHWVQTFNGLGALNDVAIFNILSLITVCMAMIGALRYFLQSDQSAYTVVSLVAAVCVWFPLIFNKIHMPIDSWGLKFHIVLSIAAYISLGFGALYACFLLLQDYRLRKGNDVFSSSLSLSYLERTMLRFTVFGEMILTLSLATGLLFIYDFWAQHISHKVVFGFISWAIIAILLLRHYRQGVRGRQAAIWVLSGFACLILAYFGSAFVLQLIFHR